MSIFAIFSWIQWLKDKLSSIEKNTPNFTAKPICYVDKSIWYYTSFTKLNLLVSAMNLNENENESTIFLKPFLARWLIWVHTSCGWIKYLFPKPQPAQLYVTVWPLDVVLICILIIISLYMNENKYHLTNLQIKFKWLIVLLFKYQNFLQINIY